jgi:hypothetical protein
MVIFVIYWIVLYETKTHDIFFNWRWIFDWNKKIFFIVNIFIVFKINYSFIFFM